jgi:serine O-acetyltransferase
MFEFVRADIHRLTRLETGTRRKLGTILFSPGLHAVLLYRLSRWLHLHHMEYLAIVITYFNSILTGAQISSQAVIGKGLAIYHPQATAIGAKAVIGNYCTLVHSNTIGQLYGADDRPIIGDYLYAAAGAKILGKIEIGNNVTVGANAVVINSLPDGVIAAAAPARIIVRAGSAPETANHGASSPDREAILRRLLPMLTSAVGEVTGIDSDGESTRLLGKGIGLDSIEMLRLIGAIEEEFQLTIDESELMAMHFQTVESLVTFIQERRSP